VPIGNAGQRLVLLNLADRANKKAECWPSQKRIARDTGLGERTVRGRLAELEALGFIARRHRNRGTGKTSDLIILLMNGKPNTQASGTEGPLPAPNAATHRQSMPQASGMSGRLINQSLINQTDPNTPKNYAIWFVLMPVPNRPDIDRYNRAVEFATEVSTSIRAADWSNAGFATLELVEGWLEKVDEPLLRQCLIETAALAGRAGTTIKSWHYFAKAVDKLPNGRA
jgi:Helix-turn-helix domain